MKNRLFAIAMGCCFASTALGPVPAGAAGDLESLYSGMQWRSIGPYTGGRVTAATGVPSQPDTFYAGASGGGLWKTEDAGVTWKAIFDKATSQSIGAVVVAPSNPNILYVGTGEYDMRSSIIAGNGVYKSVDAGKTWTHLGLDDSEQIGRIAVDPNNPNIVYVAALGHAYASNEMRGVFRSNDGGATWQKVLYKDADTGAIDLAIDPHNSKIIYASLWQTRRPPWNIYASSNGPGSGLYKSSDGGTTWKQLTDNLPTKSLGKIGIATALSAPGVVYIVADADPGGLYRSDDYGEHWTFVNRVLASTKENTSYVYDRGWYFDDIVVDPHNAQTVYVGSAGLYLSTDGGKKFKEFPDQIYEDVAGADTHQGWIDPNDSNRMIFGSDQGAFITTDGGRDWGSRNTELFGEYYRVAVDNAFPYHVYGAQQDAGPYMIPSRTSHGGISMQDTQFVTAGGESSYIAPDPLHPNILFGTGEGDSDLISREDTSGNGRFGGYADVTPKYLYHAPHRMTWTLPLVFSQHNKHVLYFGQEVLFRTADGGQNWQQISPDLTRVDPGTPQNVDPITAQDRHGGARQGVIYTIAPSPLRDGLIWTGTDDGKIWITRNEGAHWTDITPPQLTAWSKVTLIDASQHDPATAYAAVDRHRLDDFHPYIYITHDYGKTWKLAVSGIPADHFVNGIREDLRSPGLLYAATEGAVYVSFDDGSSWHSMQLNMPWLSVRDIALHGDDIIIATHGRAFWILDDITPLRQIASSSMGTGLSTPTLYTPQMALRMRQGGNPYTEDLPKVPTSENPPDGAIIDYYLPTAVQKAQIEIVDSAGHVARAYSSTEKDSPVAIAAGMHRIAWDAHYAAPKMPDLPYSEHAGSIAPLWAPPGVYKVQLTADGHTSQTNVTLRMDPRMRVSDADLVEQFTFAQKIQALQVQVLNTWIEGMKLQKDVAKNPQGQDLAGQLRSVVGFSLVPSPDDTVGPPNTDFGSLRDVADTLSDIYSAIESADQAPAPYLRAAFAKQQQAYTAALARYRELAKAASQLGKA